MSHQLHRGDSSGVSVFLLCQIQSGFKVPKVEHSVSEISLVSKIKLMSYQRMDSFRAYLPPDMTRLPSTSRQSTGLRWPLSVNSFASGPRDEEAVAKLLRSKTSMAVSLATISFVASELRQRERTSSRPVGKNRIVSVCRGAFFSCSLVV